MPKHSSKAGKSLVIDIEGGSLVELNPCATVEDKVLVILTAMVKFSAGKSEKKFIFFHPPTPTRSLERKEERFPVTISKKNYSCKDTLANSDLLNGQLNKYMYILSYI